MGLLYTTGTKNDTTAAAVGQAVAEQIRDDLVAHPAWELVEEFTAASGNVRWYVFKCLATESGLSADFFAVMGRTIATGELRFSICEGYNSGTHTMSYFPLNFGGSNYAVDATGRNARTLVLGTAVFTGSSGDPKYQSWIPSGTSSKYWLVAADDGFTVAFNGASNGFVHLGAYDPLTYATPDMALQIIGSSSADGGITRNIGVASTTIYDYAFLISGGGSTNLTGVPLGFQGSLKNNDKLQNNQRPLAEQGIIIYNSISDREPILGWAVGKQKRMRVGASGSTPSAFAWGDAYALDGTLWVPYLPTDARIWDTGVAA